MQNTDFQIGLQLACTLQSHIEDMASGGHWALASLLDTEPSVPDMNPAMLKKLAEEGTPAALYLVSLA